MRSIIEYFCPLCVAPIVNSIGGKAKLNKDKSTKETSNTTRNIIIGVVIAIVSLAVLFLIYNRKRLSSSFSPSVSSCKCGM